MIRIDRSPPSQSWRVLDNDATQAGEFAQRVEGRGRPRRSFARKTHSASRTTVMVTNTVSPSISAVARRNCSGSSATRYRTTTFVSIEITALAQSSAPRFLEHGLVHLLAVDWTERAAQSSYFVASFFGAARKRTPSGRSSTMSSAPAVQPRLSRNALGRTTCPWSNSRSQRRGFGHRPLVGSVRSGSKIYRRSRSHQTPGCMPAIQQATRDAAHEALELTELAAPRTMEGARPALWAAGRRPSGTPWRPTLAAIIPAQRKTRLFLAYVRAMFYLCSHAQIESQEYRRVSASVTVPPAAKPRNRSIEARRAARVEKAMRERLIIDLLNRGVSVAEIAARLGVTEKRMRAIVREILARRMPEPPEEFVALQISRLNEALLVAYSAMSGQNLRAVDRVMKIVRELDRYHGFFAAERRSLAEARRGEVKARRALELCATLQMAPQALEKAQSAPGNGMAGDGLDETVGRDWTNRRRSRARPMSRWPMARKRRRKRLKRLNPRPQMRDFGRLGQSLRLAPCRAGAGPRPLLRRWSLARKRRRKRLKKFNSRPETASPPARRPSPCQSPLAGSAQDPPAVEPLWAGQTDFCCEMAWSLCPRARSSPRRPGGRQPERLQTAECPGDAQWDGGLLKPIWAAARLSRRASPWSPGVTLPCPW